MPKVRKNYNYPQAGQQLDCGIVRKYCVVFSCNSLYGGLFQCKSCMYGGTSTHRKLFRVSICTHTKISWTWVCWEVLLFIISWLFHSPFWLQFLMQYFETVPSVHSYLNKTVPKCNRFLEIQKMFQGAIGSKGFQTHFI